MSLRLVCYCSIWSTVKCKNNACIFVESQPFYKITCLPQLTDWNQTPDFCSVTGPFPRGHATPVNPLVQLSYMSRVYNATQKLHPRDSISFSSLGDHSNYNFSTDAAATPNQTITFDGLDGLPTNQESSCSQDLAQLRLCNPAGCTKWTRNIQVVRGETFKLAFVGVFPNKTVLGHLNL